MKELRFWRAWPRPQRILYITYLAVFALALAYYGYSLFRGEYNALQWLTTSTLDTIEVPVKEISVGLFEFELNAENYLISQHYLGSAHQITAFDAYWFLGIFSLSIITLLSLCTYLKRFWYLIGMTAISFLLVNFRFEQLEVFGWIDNTFLILTLSVILPVSYYFQSFRKESVFILRFAAFLIITGLVAGAILIFSEKHLPFYFLISYNHASPIILSILFIILVSHEIIYFILYVVSGSELNTGKNNTRHFVALSLIYLLNVVLLYLRNAGIITWDIVYINAFFLLLISSIIGVWGFKRRENLYQHLFQFQPIGAVLYLTLGIICFSTLTYHTLTYNDPVLEAFEDVIVYSHIGFGAMFALYILANFINLLGKGLSVYKVAYKEDNMPYLSANIAGLVIAAAFYYLSNQASLQQTIAGYYNGLGSLYHQEGDPFLSEEYYKVGALFGYNNHRSNYSLGEMAFRNNDSYQAATRFKNATLKNPTEFAYINLAHVQKANGLLFESLFTLKDAINTFPDSEEVKNNLGIAFKEVNIPDSAIYYLQSGAGGFWPGKSNQTNIIEILARYGTVTSADSLREVYLSSDHLPTKSNLLAYANATGYWLEPSFEEIISDSALNLHELAYLTNFYGSKINGEVSGEEIDRLRGFADHPQNSNHRSKLIYLIAMLEYSRGEISVAFRMIDQLQAEDPDQVGQYNHTLGTMALDQQAPRLAVDYFRKALEYQHESAEVNLAISLVEAQQLSEASSTWSNLLVEDSLEIANDIILA